MAEVGSSNTSADEQPPVTVTPTPTNSAPSISPATFSVNEDEILQGNVLATDSDSDALTFAVTAQTTNGLLSFNDNGSFSYQPNNNYFGDDFFTIEVNDGNAKASAEFTINIAAVNDKPSLESVTTITRLDQAVTFTLSAQDVDGDQLEYALLTQPTKGRLALNADNTATYTPTAGALGEDTFQLSVTDGQAQTSADINIDNNLSIKGTIDLSGESINDVEVLLTADNQLKTHYP